jgi:CRP-like cAMP-binding protein
MTDLIVPLSAEKIRILDSLSLCSRYQRGQSLFYEGHRPWGLYILKSGRISLSLHPGGRSSERILIVNEPAALDILSFFRDKPHPVSAKVLTTSEICVVPKSILAELDFVKWGAVAKGESLSAEALMGRVLSRLVERGCEP